MQARQLRPEPIPAGFLAASALLPALSPGLHDCGPNRGQLRLTEGGRGYEVPLVFIGVALFGGDREARHRGER